jgi:acylphosphatase
MIEEAERLGIAGWVRNRRDGTVEAAVDGDADALEAITAWARLGPRGAHVTSVQVADVEEGFQRFELRPTE